MKPVLKIALFLLLLSALVAPRCSSAACDPTTDPCAPKKKLNAWEKCLALGFNMTSGNSETTLVTSSLGVRRESSESITDIGVSAGYGTDSTNSAPGADSTT